MKNYKKLILFLLILPIFIVPFLSLAQGDSLVPCDNVTENCDFNKLLELVNKFLNFVVIGLAVPIMAIMFCYAGFLMLTSGGKEESRTKAKRIFGNVAVGFIIAAGAFIIVKFILNLLGYDGAWIGF